MLEDTTTKREVVNVKFYYIQFYDKGHRKWYDIKGNIWLKSSNNYISNMYHTCWSLCGNYGILDKLEAIRYLKALKEVIESNSDDLGISNHINKDNIGDLRLCECIYKKECSVIDFE